MTGGGGPGPARPRELGALFADAFRIFVRNLASFLAISAAFVIPVDLIVSGIGLEQLTAPYDKSVSAAETVIPSMVGFLVTAPLVTATCVYALVSLAKEEGVRPGQAILNGLEAFGPLFLAIVLAALGIALGLLLLIVPGIYVAVRWYFVPQTVIVEGKRDAGALRRSGELTTGFWWRTAGIVLLANLAVAFPAFLIQAPLESAAESTDRELVSLLGQMAVEVLATPFIALLSTLLYYDLRAREATQGV